MELGHPKPECGKKKKRNQINRRRVKWPIFVLIPQALWFLFFNSKCESFCSVIVGREIILFLCVETNPLHPFWKKKVFSDSHTTILVVVQSLRHVQLFTTPWTAAGQASLSFTISLSLLKLMSIESVVPSNHLILSCPFSFCLQSFLASAFFPMSWCFASGGQSTGALASASASVFPMNIQGWFPLGLTGLISLQFKGLSRVFSNTTVQKHQFFGAQLSSQSNSHIHTWLLEKP